MHNFIWTDAVFGVASKFLKPPSAKSIPRIQILIKHFFIVHHQAGIWTAVRRV